ncbi:glycosyltransferase [Planococcus beijingensis]|uniref:glycosyltransferase n=1 Tax=Planococcus beijingensis TaxID=2782551 RepID=UPI00193BFFA1|nr:glycosyltransferase [Planococcus beijingensis]
MKKAVLITARSGFPNGYGAASILRKYGKGFMKLGYDSVILLLRPSEYKEDKKSLNTISDGNFEGIEYEYMSKTSFTSSNVIMRHILYLISLCRTIKYIFLNKNEIDRVFFYSPDFLISTFLIQITCKYLKIDIVGIKTESSFSDTQRTKFFLWKAKEKIIYKHFSSMIVITNYLEEQVRSFGYPKNIEVLPIVVEEDMYKNLIHLRDKKSLIYMGTLNYKKELTNLIEAIGIVKKKYSNAILYVIGDFVEKKLEADIKNLVSKLDLKDNIVWLGKVHASEIPNKLSQGGIMLLPRIAEEYSKAGFPIKLGEYLLSGSPTVVTKTGDIVEYLTDNLNAFLVEPNKPILFGEKIIEVIDNYEEALQVGLKGQKLAIEKFGVENICKVMLEC